MNRANQLRRGLLSTFLLGFLLAPSLPAQEIQGTVIQRDTKSPLPAVNLILKDTNYGTTSDSLGLFTLKGFPLGIYILETRRVGYTTNRYIVTVRNDEPIVLLLEMNLEPIKLPGVVAIDTSRQKQLVMLGKKIITAEEIKRSGTTSLSTFLSTRYPGLFPTDFSPGRNRVFRNVHFALYVNGALVQYSSDFDTMIEADQVDYIEVYRSFGMSPTSTRGSNERIVHIHTKIPEFRR